MHFNFPGAPRKSVRHFDNGEPHFLTFSCYRRLGLLSKDRTRRWFVEALNEARSIHGFHLWAWVVMPEHVHLLIWPPAASISSNPNSMKGRIRGILSNIKRPVAIKALAYLRENSPDFLSRLAVTTSTGIEYRFWQSGSGYDENISEHAALHAVCDYIHLNPVRRGLVSRPEEWKWSSAQDWQGQSDALLKVDRTLPDVLEIPWADRGN